MEKSLKIAIPNKGRLSEDVLDLLQRAGLSISRQKNSRTLFTTTHDGKYTIIFVRTQDIPSFVSNGVTDLGFTGYDIVQETQKTIEPIMDLNFGACTMVIATKEDSPYDNVYAIPENTKIATSFPNITKKFFDGLGKTVNITEVCGATEIMPQLGLADVIVDITSTGSTLKSNKLKIIGEILKSQAVIIGRPGIKEEEQNEITAFCRAIKSAIDAEEKKYLMANIPKKALSGIKNLLPGLSSPTVIDLYNEEDKVAIHVVVDKSTIYNNIDKLKKLGATGILIMTVDQMIP